MFRYSGSKKRIIKHLPTPPLFTQHIVEPFAGSLAYSVHYAAAKVTAAEANPLVRGLWEYLRTDATPERLRWLEGVKPAEKTDAREIAKQFDLSEAETTLIRLQISGAYVGQLSSWVLYPQHRLNLSPLADLFPYIKRSLGPLAADFESITPEVFGERTLAFVDPPYLNTKANYKGKGTKKDHGGLDPACVTSFVKRFKCPVLFTYGDGAQETFPDFEWRKAVVRKVPILRGGGTRDRTEWYALLNW